jgi:hypothetical protein
MDQQTLLYLFSTLAQTCAALAAFVGAVGVFRLQTLREQQSAAERDFRQLAQSVVGRGILGPTVDVLADLRKVEKDVTQYNPYLERAQAARTRWLGFPSQLRNSRRALIAFEVWNLLLIGASLAAFNHIAALACVPRAAAAGLWIIAVGTVLLTLWCVVVWTRTVEEPPP